jgi:UDP-N-acetylglucosamine diphosphorylase/glucosamine-1-phosphate N-acetyltransferase
MRERWALYLGDVSGTLTESYLSILFPHSATGHTLYVNGAVFADAAMAIAIKLLPLGAALRAGSTVLAVRVPAWTGSVAEFNDYIETLPVSEYTGSVMALSQLWDIFSLNDAAIRADFAAITAGRTSAPIPDGVVVTSKEQLFIEPGANVYAGCIINAATGPVYIGKDTEVLEGTMMRGPIAIGDHAAVKMGAKLYGATTIGPGCKVGGEINNAVFFANSNKAHDGYLGNAVIGEWCNLGADTNCSNLKNNYDTVKVRHEASGKDVSTGLTFCGLLMGDHSKCGINTMFNTGTVVGVSCNIYGGGFPDKYIPSFSWGGSDGFTTYQFSKAMETTERVYARRYKKLSPAEIAMLQHIYGQYAR